MQHLLFLEKDLKLAQLKQQAAALSAQLREQQNNSSRENRSSYKSFQVQELENLQLQIQAHEATFAH